MSFQPWLVSLVQHNSLGLYRGHKSPELHKHSVLLQATKSSPKMLSSLKVYSYHKHWTSFPFVLKESEINTNQATICTKASLQYTESYIWQQPVSINIASSDIRICCLIQTLANSFLQKSEVLEGNLKIGTEVNKGCHLSAVVRIRILALRGQEAMETALASRVL